MQDVRNRGGPCVICLLLQSKTISFLYLSRVPHVYERMLQNFHTCTWPLDRSRYHARIIAGPTPWVQPDLVGPNSSEALGGVGGVQQLHKHLYRTCQLRTPTSSSTLNGLFTSRTKCAILGLTVAKTNGAQTAVSGTLYLV